MKQVGGIGNPEGSVCSRGPADNGSENRVTWRQASRRCADLAPVVLLAGLLLLDPGSRRTYVGLGLPVGPTAGAVLVCAAGAAYEALLRGRGDALLRASQGCFSVACLGSAHRLLLPSFP